MKTILKLLSVLFIALFISCTNEEPEEIIAIDPPEEEEPQPATPVLATYLTVNVDNDYNNLTVPSEDWILVHNESGELFNYVPLQNGDNLVLEAMDTINLANMTVTKLRVNDYGNQISYTLESFGKLQPGRTLNLESITSTTPATDLGQVAITVNNVPAWNSYSLTNTQDHSPSGLSQYMAYNPGFDPSIVDITNFGFKQTTDYLMTVIDANWTPTYSWINNLTDGATISLDGSTQFSAYDQLISVPVNNTIDNFSFDVSAMNSVTNSPFLLYWTTTPNPGYVAGSSTSFNLGYLNAYQGYETNINMGNANYTYYFTKKGSPVTSGEVVFPSSTVTINDNTFDGYDFSSTANQIINYSRWGSDPQATQYAINWIVSGPTNETPLITEMPTVDFPELDLGNVLYISSRMHTQGDAYDVHTGRIFGDGTVTSYNPVHEWFDYHQ